MKCIIFAGGTGKRFWPASRKTAPKQFLPIIDNKPLVRHRYDLLLQGFKKEDIYVSTGKQYENEVKAIIPDLPEQNLILEPEMRDTGPAVTLAVSYICNTFPDEVISVQWSDHIIKKPDVFLESLRQSEKAVLEFNKIVLVGVPARFPSPHRGYIHFGKLMREVDEDIKLYEFEKFTEKPTKEVANEYIESGQYAWNPGYWNFLGNHYLSIVKEHAPQTYEVCQEMVATNFSEGSQNKFSELEKISADYIFAEHIKPEEALVAWTKMGWSDIGEWIALKEALEASSTENVTKGKVLDMNSEDTLVYNFDEDRLVATIGLNGMIVVNTKDVVAIFHKDDNTKLKEFLNRMQANGFSKYL